MCIFEVKYELSGDAISANMRQPDRGDEGIASSGDSTMNAVRRDGVDATHQEEAENVGPDLRLTLSDYCQ